MKLTRRTNKFIYAILAGLVLLIAMPALSFAQGRGRGKGSNLDKKCAKFVNCHDARDGRWDGRGPDRDRDIDDRDIFGRRTRRDRDRDIYDGRNRRIDRDGDGDFDRNDVLLGRQRRVDRDGDGDFDRIDVLLGRRQAQRERYRYDRRLWP